MSVRLWFDRSLSNLYSLDSFKSILQLVGRWSITCLLRYWNKRSQKKPKIIIIIIIMVKATTKLWGWREEWHDDLQECQTKEIKKVKN